MYVIDIYNISFRCVHMCLYIMGVTTSPGTQLQTHWRNLCTDDREVPPGTGQSLSANSG